MSLPVLTIGRGDLIVTLASSMLFSGFGSGWRPVTSATFVTLPVLEPDTTIVIVPDDPTANSSRVQLTLLLDKVHSKSLDEMPFAVRPAGTTSVTTTSVARSGPLLVTTKSKVKSAPRSGDDVLAVLTISRSAEVCGWHTRRWPAGTG